MSFALSPGSPMAMPGDQVDQLAEHHLVERRAVVVLGQHALEAGIVRLDGGHRVVDQLADGRLLGVGLQMRPARLLGHPEHVLGQIFVRVFGGGGVFGQQRGALRLEGVRDVLEEDQAERDVLVVGRLQVLAQLVGGEKQLRLEAEIGAVAVAFRTLSAWAPAPLFYPFWGVLWAWSVVPRLDGAAAGRGQHSSQEIGVARKSCWSSSTPIPPFARCSVRFINAQYYTKADARRRYQSWRVSDAMTDRFGAFGRSAENSGYLGNDLTISAKDFDRISTQSPGDQQKLHDIDPPLASSCPDTTDCGFPSRAANSTCVRFALRRAAAKIAPTTS